jgi:hypothetical protein
VDESILPVHYMLDYVRVYDPTSEILPEFTIKSKMNNLYVTVDESEQAILIANQRNTTGTENYFFVLFRLNSISMSKCQ